MDGVSEDELTSFKESWSSGEGSCVLSAEERAISSVKLICSLLEGGSESKQQKVVSSKGTVDDGAS